MVSEAKHRAEKAGYSPQRRYPPALEWPCSRLYGHLLAGVKLAVADKSGDNAVFDGPNPASRVSVSNQLTRQTIEYVHWRHAAIGEPG